MNGNILWDMTIGGVSDEYSCGVQQIDGENVIVVGSTKSYGVGGYDMWLIKVSQGNGTLPPLKPTINGPTTGTVNNEYPYTSSTTDPDGDQVYYSGIGVMGTTVDGLDLIIREKNAIRFIRGLQKEIMKSR